MGFSKEWEVLYNANKQISSWPWSDLVSYVIRYAPPKKKDSNVLEIGCGSGPNIPFFVNLGTRYHGIEGSSVIVEKIWEKYPELKKNIKVGDFTKSIPFDEKFDLVVDRGALTHNSTKDIVSCLEMIYERMNDNAKYIGIDWFSTKDSEYLKGEDGVDKFTRVFKAGPYSNTGECHFSDKEHLLDLFNKFKVTVMGSKILTREIPFDGNVLSTWNFVAEK